MQLPIPDDWNGEDWQYKLLCWPCSVQWEAILLGLVTLLARGRTWDERTSPSPTSIIDVQSVARLIYQNNLDSEGNFMGCSDLVAVLDDIKVAIEGIQVDQTSQVTIQTAIANNVQAFSNSNAQALANLQAVVVSQAIAAAQSQAWSEAFALNITPVHVINQVSLEIRPLEPGVIEAPTAEEEGETGITGIVQDTSSEQRCKRIFWFLYALQTMFNYWSTTSMVVQSSTLGFLAALSTGLSVAALKGSPAQKAFLIPAATLLQAAHFLTELYYEGLVQPAILDLQGFFNERFNNLACLLYNGTADDENTLSLQQEIISDYTGWSSSPYAVQFSTLLLYLVNLNSLAALYYVSSLIGPLDDIPAEYGGNDFCDGECGQ